MSDRSDRGIIYILTNPLYLEDVIKIGKTTDLNRRIQELSRQTAVPCPFACYYAVEIDHYHDIEKIMHVAYRGVDMATDKEHKSKEFFRVIPEKAQALLEKLASLHNGTEVDIDDDEVYTKEEKNELEVEQQQQEKRSDTKFKDIGIESGAELIFIKDNTITCTVIEDNKVLYEGETYSLTGLSKQITFEKYNQPIKKGGRNGYYEWSYEGERLWDRRKRLEAENDR